MTPRTTVRNATRRTTVRRGTSRRGLGTLLPAVILAVTALGSLGLLPGGARPAGGQTSGDQQRIGEQIDSYRAQVQEASAEETKLLAELDASAARKRELDAQVAAKDREIGTVQRNLSAAEHRLAAADAETRGAEARLAEAREELAAARAQLQAYAIAAYIGQSDATKFVEVALRSRDMGELVAKRSYMKVVATTQTEAVALDERLKDEVADLRDQLEGSRREAEVQRNAVSEERGRLQESRNAQQVVVDQVAAEIAHTDGLKRQVVARKAEFETEIAELERESAAIEATLRRRAEEERAAEAARAAAAAAAAAPASPSSPSGSSGAPETGGASAATPPPPPTQTSSGLIHPLPGAPVSSPYGYRVHPIYGDARLHTGVDLGASEGTPIRAAGSGVVVIAEWYGGYGNATIIDHGGGRATLYGHQSSMGVSAGQRVSQGQIIGRVGCTGSCTGPHLHFEVRIDGTPVNPMPYIS